jgi:hypothetical protein
MIPHSTCLDNGTFVEKTTKFSDGLAENPQRKETLVE